VVVRVPLRSSSREIGALELGRSRSGRPYGEGTLRLVEQVAADVAQAVEIFHGLASRGA
jgi:GAF domain-containing protein